MESRKISIFASPVQDITETIRPQFEAQFSDVTTAKLSHRNGILWYISVQDIIEVIIMRFGDGFARFFIIMF